MNGDGLKIAEWADRRIAREKFLASLPKDQRPANLSEADEWGLFVRDVLAEAEPMTDIFHAGDLVRLTDDDPEIFRWVVNTRHIDHEGSFRFLFSVSYAIEEHNRKIWDIGERPVPTGKYVRDQLIDAQWVSAISCGEFAKDQLLIVKKCQARLRAESGPFF